MGNSCYTFNDPVIYWKEQPKGECIGLSLGSTTLGQSVSSFAEKEKLELPQES